MPGKYNQLAGQADCSVCLDDTFTAVTTAVSCASCPSGRFTAGNGSSSCSPCSAGKKLDSKDNTCAKCDSGRFSEMQNAPWCKECPVGQSLNKTGQASCLPCLPGEFGNEEGLLVCKLCAENTFSRRSGQMSCQSCGVGEESERGSAKCTKCDAGEAGTPCVKCDEGKFRNTSMEAIDCLNCPIGWMSDEGSSKCSWCGAGTYNDIIGQGCVDCEVGKIRTSSDLPTSCKPCEAGKSLNVTGQASCLPCLPGEFGNEEGRLVCKTCNANTFSSLSGQTSCLSCPIGYISEDGSTKCQLCGAGTFGENCKNCPSGYARQASAKDVKRCQQCQAGETSSIGASVCSPCELGEFGNAPGNCENCPAGWYNDGKGETVCKPCGIDSYSEKEKATSNALCTKCSSDRSTGTSNAQISNDACLCKRSEYFQTKDETCETCPDGGNCSYSIGVTIEQVFPKVGFWRSDPNDTIFTSCSVVYASTSFELAEKRCCPTTGAEAGKCENMTRVSTDSWSADEQCLTGYAGVLCGACATNFVRIGDNCIHCKGGWDLNLAFIALILFGVVFSLGVLLFLLCSKTVTKSAKEGTKIFGQVKIILMFVQVLGSLPTVMDTAPW